MAKNNRLPPNFSWRDGRPRWTPGPTIRAQGYKACDLKDERGAWLSKGQAIDKCETLNAAVRATIKQQEGGSHSVADLVAAYRKNPTMRRAKDDTVTGGAAIVAGKLRLSDRTRQGYESYLRLIEDTLGKYPAAAITPAHLKEFYFALVEDRGLHSANACMRVVKLLFFYAIKELRWPEMGTNPAWGVKLAPTEGRLVVFTQEEIAALIAAADYAGLASVGDAITLGVMTGLRKGDLLRLTEGDLRDGLYIVTPRKTSRSSGRRAFIPVTTALRERIERMRARKRARTDGAVVHTLELIDSGTGKPYTNDGKDFDEQWRAVRFLASGVAFALEDICAAMAGLPAPERNPPFVPQPDVLDKHFADLRDTSTTWLLQAGCTVAEVAEIQGRSLKNVEIIDKHYFARTGTTAQGAGAKLEKFMNGKKIGG